MTLRSLAPALALLALSAHAQTPGFQLIDAGYFERGGVSVMAFQDFYPDGHQGGITPPPERDARPVGPSPEAGQP